VPARHPREFRSPPKRSGARAPDAAAIVGVLVHGRRRAGVIWLRATLPRKPGAPLVIRIPAAVAPQVVGRRFAACTENRRAVGTIAVNETGASWGYEPFLSSSKAGEGDTLLVEFDLKGQTAHIKLERL
jgi:hypothetical protein